MKIAILQTDHIPTHRHHFSGGNYPDMFANLFFKLSIIIDFDIFDVTIGEYPYNYDNYDGFIITGSKATAFDNVDWINHLKTQIKKIFNLNKKIVGICFGHQVLIEALGGKVERSNNGFAVGVKTVEIINQKEWMVPYNKFPSLLFYHQDMAVKLPKGSELIGTSDYCDIQIFCKNNQVLGIQAHPEMLSGHNHALIKEYKDILKNDFEKALESLRIKDNNLLLGNWIANFFNTKFD